MVDGSGGGCLVCGEYRAYLDFFWAKKILKIRATKTI